MHNRRPQRPEIIQSTSHPEDQQPNESIDKRHQIVPPTVLPASLSRLPANRGGMNLVWDGTGANSYGSRGGFNQFAKRGKPWRGKRGSSRGRGRTQNHSTQPHSPYNPPGPSMKAKSSQPQLPLYTTAHLLTKRPASPLEILNRQGDNIGGLNGNVDVLPVLKPVSSKPPSPMRQRGTVVSNAFTPIPQSHVSYPPLINNSSSSTVMLARNPTPPFKRRKFDHTSDPRPPIKSEEIEEQPVPPDALSPPLVKSEYRTPSPPPPPARRLVTESCSFYPLPPDCQKSNKDYKKNRHSLFNREYNILKSLSLQKTKVLFRFVSLPT
jgi:hypothetical protein